MTDREEDGERERVRSVRLMLMGTRILSYIDGSVMGHEINMKH